MCARRPATRSAASRRWARDADARARRSRADRFDIVYAAGGTPNALFPIAPADLVRASGGTVADVAL
jgi:hypothetical protein